MYLAETFSWSRNGKYSWFGVVCYFPSLAVQAWSRPPRDIFGRVVRTPSCARLWNLENIFRRQSCGTNGLGESVGMSQTIGAPSIVIRWIWILGQLYSCCNSGQGFFCFSNSVGLTYQVVTETIGTGSGQWGRDNAFAGVFFFGAGNVTQIGSKFRYVRKLPLLSSGPR